MKPSLFSIARTYRHVNRYRELIGILIKYGFQDLVERLNLRYYLELGKSVVMQRPVEHVQQIPRAARVRMIIEEMGTTFIKFGQIMSTRPDLIPEEFLKELQKLQDEVPPFPTEQAIALITSELEAPLDQLFKEFDPTPIASASIGQVYRAVLPDGTPVAVKVQRPDIQKIIEVDIEIMLTLARLAETHLPEMQVIQPVAIVEEFARVLDNEMNYHVEARNMERFAENFRHSPHVQAPRVFRDYSSRVILTCEYVEGIKISELALLREQGYDTVTLARIGAEAVLTQIFEHGFFHGDPHPGNILVTGPERICFLDFGMMGRLDKNLQEDLATVLVCVVQRDDDHLTRTVLHMATNPDETRDPGRLKRALADFVDRYAYIPFDQLNMGELLNDLLSLLIRHNIKLPPEIYLLIKALVSIEGLGRRLDPNFVFITHAEPFVARIVRQRYSVRRMLQDINHTSLEVYRLVRDLPEELRALLKFIRRGELRINLETRSMEPVMKTWDRDANRLAYAIVVASLLISASIVLLARVPPLWNDMSILGLVGLGAALIMGFWLLIAIYLSGHL